MAELRATIDRLRDLRALIADPAVKRVTGALRSIPVLPQVFIDLGRVIGDDDSSVDDVAHIVERDAGTAARVLQLANSAYFGPGRPVVRISEAVSFLGLNLLRSLTLAVGIFDQFNAHCPGFDAVALQDRSLQVATLAARILAGDPLSDVAFMAGVLHDLGQLVLASQMTDEFAQALALARTEQIPLHQAEQRVIGVDHALVGGYIIGIWGLPIPLVEAVVHHHHPERMHPTRIDAVGALHIAEVLVSEARAAEGSPGLERISPALSGLAGVEGRLPDWRSRARIIAGGGS
jgi:HD-like signal output (HDOD) protein